jgi:RHS repeat-associated protein
LVAIRDSFFGNFLLEYDEAGSISREILPNGLIRSFMFNQEDQLSRSLVIDGSGTCQGERYYRYDGNGEIIRESSGGEITEFSYDAGRRLQTTRGSGITEESFIYDPDENLLRYQDGPEFSYSDGRLLAAGDVRYQYDGSGRVIRRVDPSGPCVFEYSLGGLISKATLSDGRQFSYEYDGLGRRVLKRSLSETIRYFWDGDVLLAETRAMSGVVETRFYLFLPDTFLPLAHSVGNRKFYYDVDQRGTVRDVYDAQGLKVARYRYLGFGGRQDRDLLDPQANSPFRLPGQYFDEETGLHYNRFRYFDPMSARFLSSDPWSHEVETNPYSYGPNPVGWLDPLGLARVGDFTRSQASSIKEANRKANKGFYKCPGCGFKNKNKVFAVSKETGRPVGDGAFHADHKNPLGRGGTGNPKRNGQALGGTCNCSKGKRRKPGMT